MPQRLHWIDFRNSPGWQEARQTRYPQEQGGHNSDCQRVVGTDAVEHRGYDASRGKRPNQSDRESDQR